MVCLKKVLALSLLMLMLLSLATIAQAESGTIYDFTPYNIVGMWVEVSGGTSGWATLTQTSVNVYDWYFDAQGKEWRAHVGIGGTPQNWMRNEKTNRVWGSKDIEIHWSGMSYAPVTIRTY